MSKKIGISEVEKIVEAWLQGRYNGRLVGPLERCELSSVGEEQIYIAEGIVSMRGLGADTGVFVDGVQRDRPFSLQVSRDDGAVVGFRWKDRDSGEDAGEDEPPDAGAMYPVGEDLGEVPMSDIGWSSDPVDRFWGFEERKAEVDNLKADTEVKKARADYWKRRGRT